MTRVHGHACPQSPTYGSWRAMKQRCTNPGHPEWGRYGGRNIVVADRWLTFENFLADMGERPEGTTLDRFPDREGNYEPGNCRWATPAEQARNRRRRTGDALAPEVVALIEALLLTVATQREVGRLCGVSHTSVRKIAQRRHVTQRGDDE